VSSPELERRGLLIAVTLWAHTGPTPSPRPHSAWVFPVWIITDVVLDLLIVLCMILSLMRHRTGFPSTDSILARMIRHTVQTGLITSISCIGVVVSFFCSPVNDTTVGLMYTTCSLYVLAMLANLHSRDGLRRLIQPRGSETIPMPLSTF